LSTNTRAPGGLLRIVKRRWTQPPALAQRISAKAIDAARRLPATARELDALRFIVECART
jgi:hypothetical protein